MSIPSPTSRLAALPPPPDPPQAVNTKALISSTSRISFLCKVLAFSIAECVKKSAQLYHVRGRVTRSECSKKADGDFASPSACVRTTRLFEVTKLAVCHRQNDQRNRQVEDVPFAQQQNDQIVGDH